MTFQNITNNSASTTQANENFQSIAGAGVYGQRQPGTVGLTLGYWGGYFDGADRADGTVALTASSTVYVVLAKSGYAVSSSTSATNYNDSTNYWRIGVATTGAATITAFKDARFGPGGTFAGGAAGGGAVTSVNTQTGAVVLDAGDIGITDTGAYFTGTDVETALQEIGAAGATATTQSIIIACSDETTALTAGVAKVTFRMPFAFTLSAVRSSATTAPTGSVLTVDINEGGASILSTKITIDATEKTSTTAAAAPVISDAALADDAEITIDIDAIGSTIAGAGLKVYLIGVKT